MPFFTGYQIKVTKKLLHIQVYNLHSVFGEIFVDKYISEKIFIFLQYLLFTKLVKKKLRILTLNIQY